MVPASHINGLSMKAAYDPNRQGWGFAAVICVLTAGLFFTAYTIHNNTYRHPRDPMARQVYQERDAAASSNHEAAAQPAEGH